MFLSLCTSVFFFVNLISAVGAPGSSWFFKKKIRLKRFVSWFTTKLCNYLFFTYI
jgi:hypothetical protein